MTCFTSATELISLIMVRRLVSISTQSVRAFTVAVRGRPASRPISPKNSPWPSVTTSPGRCDQSNR